MRAHTRLVVMTALATLSMLIPGVPASAQTFIDVRVQVSATQVHTIRTPEYSFRITAATQVLPPGVTVEGLAECTEVWTDGSRTTKFPTYGPDVNTSLEAGVWYFVPNSCRSIPSDPIRLVGVGAPYRIILQGGPYVVAQAPTAVEPTSLVGYVDNDPNKPVVTLVAEVVTIDNSSLADVDVLWDWEGSSGGSTCTNPDCMPSGDFVVLEGCTARTTRLPDRPWLAIATCVLQGGQAKDLIAGTGAYTAYFKGTRSFASSAARGVVPEATGDRARAGQLLSSFYSTPPVEIHQTYIPPGCGLEAVQGEQATLTTALIGDMDCRTLSVAKLLTGIALVVVVSGAAASAPAALASIAQIKATAAYAAALGKIVPTGSAIAKQVALLAYSIGVTASNVGGNVALYGHVFSRPQ